MLSVSHVGKNYDGNWALKDVSFVSAANRVTAVCGENGAGKSTLMRILSGAIQPDTGEIKLGEDRVEIADPHHAIALAHHEAAGAEGGAAGKTDRARESSGKENDFGRSEHRCLREKIPGGSRVPVKIGF